MAGCLRGVVAERYLLCATDVICLSSLGKPAVSRAATGSGVNVQPPRLPGCPCQYHYQLGLAGDPIAGIRNTFGALMVSVAARRRAQLLREA
jgi:hypothetical protein